MSEERNELEAANNLGYREIQLTRFGITQYLFPLFKQYGRIYSS